MYDTRRRKALFEKINNRSWEALRLVIRKWVAAGSVIVTDEWKGYTRLPSCLWLLPAGQRGSCRLRRANHRRLEKLTNERADGRLEVPVAVTGRSKRELSIEESQPSTIGEANQRTRRRKTGRYDCVLRPLTLHAYLQCLWLLPAGQRGSGRMRRANHRRLEKLTNERADGRLEVPVAVTGRAKRELSNEESQSSTHTLL
nr:unnamed protein product [Spirometra erinaceieuropaei]